MNRKDTILVAVVINTGLLAILFVTAVIYDTDKVLDQSDFNSSLVDIKASKSAEVPSSLIVSGPTGDEVDNVLNDYSRPSSSVMIVDTNSEIYTTVSSNSEMDGFVEITVKKGDMLEKIAKANGTTISAIKKANQLKSEQLVVGQVLKIPARKSREERLVVEATPQKKDGEGQEGWTSEPEYYTIRSGDNPWKLAKQLNVKYEDILRLNSLDESKAKNLKIGDRIRVK